MVKCMHCYATWNTVAESMEHPCFDPETLKAFNVLRDLEIETKSAWASVAFIPPNASDREHLNRKTAWRALKARTYAAMEALTPAQAVVYGAWRRVEMSRWG